MPLYSFEGRRERTGERVTGQREAASHAALGQDLLTEGILLTHYEEKGPKITQRWWLSGLTKHVSVIEKALFARYFALMLRAGLDIKRALSALQEQTNSKGLKLALSTIYQDVERGKTLAESMNTFPAVFNSLFVSFIRVGETTGRLQESLEILAAQLKKEYELRRAVRGALLYPAVILCALFAVAFTMLVFVIPKLAEVFEGFNVALPLPTRILLAIGTFFSSFWYIVLAGMVGGVLISIFLWRQPQVKRRLLRWFLLSPVVGSIMQKVNIARFSRNLSSLLSSGVAFTEALDILSANTPHPAYAAVFLEAEQHVKQGKPLSNYLAQFTKLFPPLIINVIRVGEETGDLDKVLEETALFYEGEVDQTMKNLTSVLEPTLMIVIGLAVGALAISVISPIYNLVNVI